MKILQGDVTFVLLYLVINRHACVDEAKTCVHTQFKLTVELCKWVGTDLGVSRVAGQFDGVQFSWNAHNI